MLSTADITIAKFHLAHPVNRIVAVNYYDAGCVNCNKVTPGPHRHESGTGSIVWVVPSSKRPNYAHEVYWDDRLEDWACTCEHFQVHGFHTERNNHIMLIQNAFLAGLSEIPGSRTTDAQGTDSDLEAAFTELLPEPAHSPTFNARVN